MPRKSRIAKASEEHELARLKLETLQFTSQANVLEAYSYAEPGRVIDATDRHDAEGWTNVNQLAERDPQRHVGPFIQNLTQLGEVRAAARMVMETNGFAIGFVDHLTNYVVGEGFTYRASTKTKHADAIVAAVQDAVDEFLDENDFAELEQEVFQRTRIDGEAFLRYWSDDDGRLYPRIVEPEQVEPQNGVTTGDEPEWSWGVKHLREYREDAGGELGYWHEDPYTIKAFGITYGFGSDQQEWLEVSAGDVDHIKVNVVRNVKRGVSDFFPLAKDFDNIRKLVRNLRDGAAVQAAIAGIKQYEKAGSSAVESAMASQRTRTRTDSTTNRNVNEQRVEPGQILHMGPGQTWQPPPMWSSNSSNHIQIVQAALRAILNRWCMPEFFTSDASNANFSSTLVAGSPFVRQAKKWQAFYKRRFSKIVWRALRLAFLAGRFRAVTEGMDWLTFRKLIEVQCEAPTAEIANRLEEANIANIAIQAKVMSKQTARQRMGLDNEQELVNLKEEPPEPAQPPGGGGGPAPMMGGRKPPTGNLTEAAGDIPDNQDPETLARETAAAWNDVEAGGGQVEDSELEQIGEKLAGTGWLIYWDGEAWAVGAAGEFDFDGYGADIEECGGKGGKPGPCPVGGSKDKPKGSKRQPNVKLQAAEAKVKAINAKVSKAKEKLDTLKSELKTARADVSKMKADIKQQAGVGKAHSAIAAQSKEAVSKIGDLSKQWTAKASSAGLGKSGLSEPQMQQAITAAIGKGSPHQVAKQLGIATRFKSKAAAIKGIQHRIIEPVTVMIRARL